MGISRNALASGCFQRLCNWLKSRRAIAKSQQLPNVLPPWRFRKMRRALMIRTLLLGTIAVAAMGGSAWVVLPPPPDRPRVVLIAGGASPYWEALAAGARAAAQEDDIDLQVVSPPSEAGVPDQSAALASIDVDHVHGVVFCPADATAHNAQINALAERTFVMTCCTNAPDSNHVGHIGPGYYSSGSVCAELVREMLPAGGKIAVLTGPCQSRQGERLNGLEGALRAGVASENPARWSIVRERTERCIAERCENELQQLLAANPDVACVVCFGPRQCEAAVDVLSAGNDRRIKIVAFDPNEAVLDDLAAGRLDAVLAVDPFELGRRAIDRMGVLFRGSWAQLPMAGAGADFVRPDVVTRETVAAYRARHAGKLALELAAN
jgi:ribose transport system substrate-binding protein